MKSPDPHSKSKSPLPGEDRLGWWSKSGNLPLAYWLAVLFLAATLRLIALDAKPAHFDEGVNGWFLEKMKSSAVYDYDYKNYHGPLHFYLGFPFVAVMGNTEPALRLPSVLLSLGTVSLLLGFSTTIGRLPALLASVFFATSTGSVFYARYGIHESALTFFVTLFAISLTRLYLTGAPRWLMWLVLALTGGILIKETFFINMLTLPMAALAVTVIDKYAPALQEIRLPPPATQNWSWYFLLTVVFVSAAIVELFYSSWGNSPHLGWGEFAKAYSAWSETGSKGAGHVKTQYDILGGSLNYYWLSLMTRYEWPFLIAMVAAVIYWNVAGYVGHVMIFWACGTILAYSLIPYKTPWCILSMMPSMSLVVGIFLSYPFLSFRRVRVGVISALVVSSSTLPYAIHLNFKEFDNPKEPYVYVQTSREARRFVNDLNSAAEHDSRFFDLPGVISLDSYYPLPWWLSSYSQIEYGPERAPAVPPSKYWVLISWKNLTEFLEKNSTREWRHYRFKLRDSQEDVVAIFDKNVFPEGKTPEYPAPLEK